MNGALRMGRKVMGLVFVALAIAWGSYHTLGHATLASLHAGSGPTRLASVAARLQALPLDYVTERADTLVAFGMRVAALLWIMAAVALDPAAWRLRRPPVGPGQRTGVDAPQGQFAKSGPDRPWLSRMALAGGVLLFLLAPWLWLKLAGIAVSSVMLLPAGREFTLSAAGMRLLWYAVFLFAFVCAPYWTLLETLGAQVLALAALLVGGWWWSGLAAASLTLTLRFAAVEVAGVALVAASIHLIPAGIGVPWSGDEDYHITQVAYLSENLPPVWLAAAFAMLLFLRSHARGGSTQRQTILRLAATAALCGAGYPQLEDSLARYPYFLRWFEAAPVQLLFPIPSLFYREALIRTSSLICMMGLAAAVCLVLRRKPGIALGAAVATVTLPTLQYYGSQLYLELPAIALLVVAALRANVLMGADAEAVRRDPGWIALVLAGFAKETMLPVLVAFVGCRVLRGAWAALMARDALPQPGASFPLQARVLAEARLGLAVVAPLGVYLWFRATQDIFRGYPGYWAHYLQMDLWRVLAGSLWEQFGVLTILGVVGTVAFCRRGAWGLFWLWGWLAAATAFNLGDVADYVGYSRYNLLLLPPLLAVSIWWLARTSARVGAIWLLAILCANFALTPLRADGARQLHWGNPQADVGERYYPFRDVFAWLKAVAPDARILFAGTTYPYYWNFYFEQLGWHPDFHFSREHADPNPATAAQSASAAQCDLIVWQPIDAAARVPPRLNGYRIARLFPGEGVLLAVYVRSP